MNSTCWLVDQRWNDPALSIQISWNQVILLFQKNIGWHLTFFGMTDTPVLAFWWCVLWVSKPEWAALFTLGRGVHVTYSMKSASGVTPTDHLTAGIAAVPFTSTYLLAGIGGAQNCDLLCCRQMLYQLSYADSTLTCQWYIIVWIY